MSIVTVVRVWLLSFGVTVVVALVCAYFIPLISRISRILLELKLTLPGIARVDLILNKISWLDNLGRVSRHKKNTKYENFLTELQRLTLVHEGHAENGGGEYYRLAPGSASKPQAGGDADADEGQKAKSADAKKKGEAAKDPDAPDNKKDVEAGGDRNGDKDDDGASSPTSDGDNDTAAE